MIRREVDRNSDTATWESIAPEEIALEAERYELFAPAAYRFEPDRRDFFRLLGCGVLVLLVRDESPAQESGGGRRRGGFGQRPTAISAWLHVGDDGTVTAFTGKAEVGQNIRTSLTQAVAEELHVPVDSIRLVMADTGRTPFDMGTFGSRSTPDMGSQFRSIAAAARETLVDLAAERFKVEREMLVAEDGQVRRRDMQESVAYAQLTAGKELVRSATSEIATAPPSEWKIAGTSVPKVNGRDFVTGRHKYTPDFKLPGMLRGKILRPAGFEATLASIDASRAAALTGVSVVQDGNFVGVVAPDEQTAEQALSAIDAQWTVPPQPSDRELFDYLREHQGQGGGRGGFGGGGRNAGSIDEGMAAADEKLRQTYTVAYIAHAPLEPRAAVAQWEEGKLTVWTGTQRPFGVRGELAQAFGLADDRVRVIVPDTGSGYGGKHTGEAAVEAARLAKAVGKPVKLVWTREEEFTWAYARPAGVIDVAGGARSDGTITAWEFHNYNSGGSAINPPYEIANQKVQFHGSRSPLKQGSYRALAATANHFARESFIDELAHAVKMDPLDFRLKNLKDARMRAVLEAAAQAFDWAGGKLPEGRGRGIAAGTEKGSYIGTCAEVAVDRGRGAVRVVRVTAAFECGAVVNPNHLKNQIEGAIVMGLGGALFEALQFGKGRITNPQFSGYRVPRFRDAPAIDVVLVDRKDLASIGAGETPIVGIAPAVGNAIFDAVGMRLRSMPMVPDGLKTALG